jgi:hypothetical protein
MCSRRTLRITSRHVAPSLERPRSNRHQPHTLVCDRQADN